ncbi:hypothetical protein O181_060262 [Austropuccinia psidii MF-1]|uniref:BED-type domain-containing protein n=1 Tax=Austropuccinia psidii MF-1 TaxID=1389203 RepID=A0A9Q3EN91_9BASI|nr:hypothetical protein [Austropuccinia psidii MF-1]
MSSAIPSHLSSTTSRLSTPSEFEKTTPTTQASSDATTTSKQSWFWLYFSEVNDQMVECNVINCFGKNCHKKLKCDQTGSTKAMTQNLSSLHHLHNPNQFRNPKDNY